MTMTVSNPLNRAIEDGYSIRDTLNTDAMQLRMALEQRADAIQAHQSAKTAYQDAEAEWLAEFVYSDGRYATAKNAEQREIVKDAALVKARSSGPLAHAWGSLTYAKLHLDNAELAYAQAETMFKAVRTAAELTANLLRAATV